MDQVNFEHLKKLSGSASNGIAGIGSLNFGTMTLENVKPDALRVTEENLHEHVSIQPSAIAFYAKMYKDALRYQKRIEFEYDVWRKKVNHEVKKSCTEKKVTISELESLVVAAHEAELVNWNNRLDEAQEIVDNIESLYNGWKQKGFTTREFIKLREDELRATGSIPSELTPEEFAEEVKPEDRDAAWLNQKMQNSGPSPENFDDSARRVKDMIRQRKLAKGGATTSTPTETPPTL